MPNKSFYRTTIDGSVVPVLLTDNGDGTWSEAAGSGAGGTSTVALRADARQGKLSGGLWTLGSITVVESIAIPDTANGFRLRPSADLRFAIGEDPVVLAGESLVVGNTAFAGENEVRLLEAGTGRTLRLLGTVAGQTVSVGFW